MSRLGLGLVFSCGLAAGCTETYLFQRTELVASARTAGMSVHGVRNSDGIVRLIPYEELRLSKDNVDSLVRNPQRLARLKVRSPGFFHQVAGALVLGSLVPMAILGGAAVYDLRGTNLQTNFYGPVLLSFLGATGLIAGPALLIKAATLDYAPGAEE